MARIVQSTLPLRRFFSTDPAKVIKIPPRIERGPTDILKALAATVGRDPTAPHYKFVDDPGLEPLGNVMRRTYALSKEQGRRAARYFLVNYPHLFYRDDAEPKISAFNPPEKVTEGVKCVEEDIIMSIQGNQVANAIQCYKNCIEQKVPVSSETQLMLLELCCFSNSKDVEYEWSEERWYLGGQQDHKDIWLEDSFADSLFKTLGENEATLNAMICGLVKHGSYDRAYSLYERAKELGLPISSSTYNALILTAPSLSQSGDGRWERILEILEHMKRHQVRPDLDTFTNILCVLSRTSMWRESQSIALRTFNEMHSLKIAPSLASYYFIIRIFTESRVSPPEPEILYSIINQLKSRLKKPDDGDSGKLVVSHLKDGTFFPIAMKSANSMLHNLDLATEIHEILVANPHLMDSAMSEMNYYREFFSLLTKTASLDQLMKIYDELVPHTFVPDANLYADILNAVFLYDQIHLVPRLWTDIAFFGVSNHSIELLRHLMENLTRQPASEAQYDDLQKVVKDIDSKIEELKVKSVTDKDLLRNLILKFYVINSRLEEAESVFTQLSEEDAIIETDLIEKFVTSALEQGDSSKIVFGLKMAHLVDNKSSFSIISNSLDKISKEDPNYETIKELVK